MMGVTRTPILPHTRHSCAQRVDGCAPPGAPVLGECVDPIGRARSPVALCPSLRVLSPPQLATRFVRRHKARRRLPDASSAEQTTPEGATTTRRTCPTGGLRPSKNWQRSDSPRKAQGKTGGHAWTGLRAFPTRFPPPSAQRTSQDLDTSAQLFVGRENSTFRLASGGIAVTSRYARDAASGPLDKKTHFSHLNAPSLRVHQSRGLPARRAGIHFPPGQWRLPGGCSNRKAPRFPNSAHPRSASRSRRAALLSSRRIAPLDGSMGPAQRSRRVPRVFSWAFSIAPRR